MASAEEKAEMEEEAREEWEDRGFDPDEFELEKMIEMWEAEDMESNEKAMASGSADALARKQEAIDAMKVGLVDWDKYKRTANKVLGIVKQDAQQLGKGLYRAMELPAVKKRRLLREHREVIDVQEEDALRQQHAKDELKGKLHRHHEWEKQKMQGLAYKEAHFAEIKKMEQRGRDAARKADRKQKADHMDALKAKWKHAADEEERLVREDRERRFKAQQRYRRKLNDLYWGKQAKEGAAEAQQARRALVAYQQAGHAEAVAGGAVLAAAREEEYAEQQRFEPALSSMQVNPDTGASLGVFGVPMGPGEFANPRSGGFNSALDSASVDLWTGPQPAAFEIRRTQMVVESSRVTAMAQELARLAAQESVAADEAVGLLERRERYTEELGQIAAEEAAQELRLGGPPRQAPRADEMEATHERKQRARDVRERHGRTVERIAAVGRERGSCRKKHLVLQAKWTSAAKELAEEEEALRRFEADNPQLPMVVGTRLEDVKPFHADGELPPGHDGDGDPGGKPADHPGTTAPAAAMDYVVLDSKLQILKAAAVPAQRAFREARKLDIGTWRLEEEKIVEGAELERLYNRMAIIEDRLKGAVGGALREDLTNAMRLWRANDHSLNKTMVERSGKLDWWGGRLISMTSAEVVPSRYSPHAPTLPPLQHAPPPPPSGGGEGEGGGGGGGAAAGSGKKPGRRASLIAEPADPRLAIAAAAEAAAAEATAAMAPDGSVKLGMAYMGVCQGRIKLPQHGVWVLRFTVSKEDEWGPEQGDDSDQVVVHIGPSLQALEKVGEYKNRRAPGQRSIRYKIEQQFVGAFAAFRFEWKCTNNDAAAAAHHLVVSAGTFVQGKIPPMEVMEGGRRVLSDHVKMVRLEAAQGKTRTTQLLEELVKIDDSRAPLWDCQLWHHGVAQRFQRKDLRALLRHRLKAEGEKERRELAKERADAKMNDAARLASRRQQKADAYGKAGGEEEEEPFDAAADARRMAAKRRRRSQQRRKASVATVAREEAAAELEAVQEAEQFKPQPQRVQESEHRFWTRRAQKAQRGADTESGKLLVKKVVEVWSDVELRWRRAKVVAFKAEWLEHGTVLRKQHLLRWHKGGDGDEEADAADEDEAEAVARDKAEHPDVDSDAELEAAEAMEAAAAAAKLKGEEGRGARREKAKADAVQARRASVAAGPAVSASGVVGGGDGYQRAWSCLDDVKYTIVDDRTSAIERARKEAGKRAEAEAAAAQREADAEHAAQAKELADFQAQVDAEDADFEAGREADVEQRLDAAKEQATGALKTAAVKRELKLKSREVAEEMKRGVGLPGGTPKFLTPKEAMAEAQKRFVAVNADIARADAQQVWKRRRNVFLSKRATRIEVWTAEREAAAAARSAERQQLAALKAERAEAAKRKLRRTLRIPADRFAKALPPQWACEHPRCRAWGADHDKGIRCLDCGAEVSRSYKRLDADVGGNWKLDALVRAHRANESGFRFTKDAGGKLKAAAAAAGEDDGTAGGAAQLRLVEAERLRLEKERREVEAQGAVFYDLGTMRAVHDFDLRHHLKAAKAPRDENGKLIAADVALAGCPTFRRHDAQHKAEYQDLLHFYGRINAYRSKVAELHVGRQGLARTQESVVAHLVYLHTSLPKADERLRLVEMEHGRSEAMLQRRKDVDDELEKTQRHLTKALAELDEANVALEGRVELADKLEREHSALVRRLRQALRLRIDSAKALKAHLARQKELNAALAAKSTAFDDSVQAVVRMQYRKPRGVVPTPFGRATVLFYREEDKCLVLTPAGMTGNPAARMYMPLERVVLEDQRRQEGERQAMGAEDEASAAFDAADAAMAKAERAAMGGEDAAMAALMKWEASQDAERRDIAAAVARAEEDCRWVLGTELKRAELKAEARAEVTLLAAERKERHLKWKAGEIKGEKKHFRKMSPWEQFKEARKRVDKKRAAFARDEARRADRETRLAWRNLRSKKAATAGLSFFVTNGVEELILEVAREALRESEDEKARAQRESRIVFEYPEFGKLHFGIYQRLHHQWLGRKAELRHMITAWGQMGEEARARREEQERRERIAEAARLAREAAEARCAEMLAAEMEMRAFMREEMAACLAERRAMGAEEAATRATLEARAKAEKQAEEDAAKFGAGDPALAALMAKGQEDAAPTKNDGKRTGLKQRKLEKRRQEAEWAAMEAEDRAGAAMRVAEQRELMQKKMEEQEQLVVAADDGGEDESDDDDDDDDDDESESEEEEDEDESEDESEEDGGDSEVDEEEEEEEDEEEGADGEPQLDEEGNPVPRKAKKTKKKAAGGPARAAAKAAAKAAKAEAKAEAKAAKRAAKAEVKAHRAARREAAREAREGKREEARAAKAKARKRAAAVRKAEARKRELLQVRRKLAYSCRRRPRCYLPLLSLPLLARLTAPSLPLVACSPARLLPRPSSWRVSSTASSRPPRWSWSAWRRRRSPRRRRWTAARCCTTRRSTRCTRRCADTPI